ncbi:MAG: exodeoxyribonuclease V subunit gamma [bacterium]
MSPSVGFSLYQSNKLELLADKAIPVIENFLDREPLKKNFVVVQTSGMGRWLSLQIGRNLRICANIEAVLPEKFINFVSSDLLKMESTGKIYETEVMRWFIYELLSGDFINCEELETLKSYVSGDEVKKYQISGRIADLFDQYQIFRPDLIAKWKEDKVLYKDDREELWQKKIYLKICSSFPDELDRIGFLKKFDEKINSFKEENFKFPKGVVLFGISTMSEYQLTFFKSLSKVMKVHLFHLNPSREYWGNICSPSELLNSNSFSFESNNLFLSQFGFAGKAFLNMLTQAEGHHHDFIEDEDGEKSILHIIQNEIKNCSSASEDKAAHYDSSITINGCWGKMREMEVLKDELLNLFDSNPSLNPRDIIVMAPKIEDYSDYIEAVFGSNSLENTIPFTVADKPVIKESDLVEPFLKVLSLDESNFSKSDLFAIFENTFIHEKFKVQKEDIGFIKETISKSGVKWGIDGPWRKEKRNYDESEQNTWRFGIDRILLGGAMAGDEFDQFEGISPLGELEDLKGREIAKFITFAELVFEFCNRFYKPKTVEKWVEELNFLISSLFVDNIETTSTIKYLRNSLNRLLSESVSGGLTENLPLGVIKNHLSRFFSNLGFGRGFLNGQVTFCSLKPMRSIPFKVIALIGMDEESFPRNENSVAFDLIAKYPKESDRFIKENDKYLFLEALICAREKLIVSYCAKNLADSSLILPASPVEFLKNYIVEKCNVSAEKVEKLHPLTPFSSRYFTENSPLFTYSEKDFHVAKKFYFLDKEKESPLINAAIDISKIDEKKKKKILEITPEQFFSFFENPQKYFFQNILELMLPYTGKSEDDLETLFPDYLQQYNLKDKFTKMALSGLKEEDFYQKIAALGKAPHGNIGKTMTSAQLNDEMKTYLKNIEESAKGRPVPVEIDLNFEFKGETLVIKGQLENIYEENQVFFRPSSPKIKDKLKGLLFHLLMNGAGIQKETLCYFLKKGSRYKSTLYYEAVSKEKSLEELKELADIYFESLSKMPLFNIWMVDKVADKFSYLQIFQSVVEEIDKDPGYGGMPENRYFDFAAEVSGFFDFSTGNFSKAVDFSRVIASKIKSFCKELQ